MRSSPRRSERFPQTLTGIQFGRVSLRVLHAPMFDRFAPEATKKRILDAIREFPAKRAADFAQFERPMYLANGYSPELLEQMTPRADEPLTDRRFRSPILLVAAKLGAGVFRRSAASSPSTPRSSSSWRTAR